MKILLFFGDGFNIILFILNLKRFHINHPYIDYLEKALVEESKHPIKKKTQKKSEVSFDCIA